MKSLELPHLAEPAPAQIALPRVSQICVGNALHASRRVKPCGYLMGDALVLDEAVLASGLNGLLVETHGIGVPTFDARELCRHQSVLVGERRWIVFGPLAQLFPMRRQEVAPPALLLCRRVLIERRHRQCGVVIVVE